MFETLNKKQFADRIAILLYGKVGAGKTTRLFQLAKEYNQAVLILSFDKGLIRGVKDPEISKRTLVDYPSNLQELRETIKELKTKFQQLTEVQKIPSNQIWIAIDTINAMQNMLLTESRKINLRNPSSFAIKDEIIREAITQPDWGINLTHMVEFLTAIMNIPCNIVFLALERIEEDEMKNKIALPSISGQSLNFVMGLCDIIARIIVTENKERAFICDVNQGCEARDRLGKLDPVEKADLYLIREKALK